MVIFSSKLLVITSLGHRFSGKSMGHHPSFHGKITTGAPPQARPYRRDTPRCSSELPPETEVDGQGPGVWIFHQNWLPFFWKGRELSINGLTTKGKSTHRKPARFSHEIWDVSVIFPLNQLIESKAYVMYI